MISINPGLRWHLKDAADCIADGNRDLLWQQISGAAATSEMNGVIPMNGTVISPNPGAGWHLILYPTIAGSRVPGKLSWEISQHRMWLRTRSPIAEG